VYTGMELHGSRGVILQSCGQPKTTKAARRRVIELERIRHFIQLRQKRNECNLTTHSEDRNTFTTACSQPGGAAAFILARFYSHLPPASAAASYRILVSNHPG
jgi:hypothetical protein